VGLTEKVVVRLSKEDLALLARVAKARRIGKATIIREALMESFARRGFLSEEEKAALDFSPGTIPETSPSRRKPSLLSRAPTLSELLESERERKTLRNEQ
jgi:hypothetical protein